MNEQELAQRVQALMDEGLSDAEIEQALAEWDAESFPDVSSGGMSTASIPGHTPLATPTDASRQLSLPAGREQRAVARERNIEGIKGMAANAALGASLNLIDDVPGLGGIGERARQFQSSHPALANIAQVAGGVAAPVPGVAAAYKALKPTTLGAKMAAGARIGGVVSGVNAFGASEGGVGKRAMAGAKAVPMGAVIGGALPAVAPVVRAAEKGAKAMVQSPRKGLAVVRSGYRAATGRLPYPNDAAVLASWRPPWMKSDATPGQLLDDVLPAQRAIDPNLGTDDFAPPRAGRPMYQPGPRDMAGVTRQGDEMLESALTPTARTRPEPAGLGAVPVDPTADLPIVRGGFGEEELTRLPTTRTRPEPPPLGPIASAVQARVPQKQMARTMSGLGGVSRVPADDLVEQQAQKILSTLRTLPPGTDPEAVQSLLRMNPDAVQRRVAQLLQGTP